MIFASVASALVAAIAMSLVRPATPSLSSTPSPALVLTTSSPAATVAATLPSTVDGLPVRTVGKVLAERAVDSASSGPIAVSGYWSVTRRLDFNCVPPLEALKDCAEGTFGITERNEEIQDETTGRITDGPFLTPFIPCAEPEIRCDDRDRLFLCPLGDGACSMREWQPIPIVVVGHFADALAAICSEERTSETPIPAMFRGGQTCDARIVIDRIVVFDPMSVGGPEPVPVPTPFPYTSPPPALFGEDVCYPGEPKAFVGWINEADLALARAPEWSPYVPTVYAIATRDVLPLQYLRRDQDKAGWFDSNAYPGHKARWWGQAVCRARQNPTAPSFPAEIEYSATYETTFLELDDGRRLYDEVFRD